MICLYSFLCYYANLLCYCANLRPGIGITVYNLFIPVFLQLILLKLFILLHIHDQHLTARSPVCFRQLQDS